MLFVDSILPKAYQWEKILNPTISFLFFGSIVTLLKKLFLTILDLLLWFSAFSFLFYGISCLTSAFMVNEFIRYGIPQYRKLTGILQILGGLGIIIGFWVDHLQFISVVGLSVLMLLGVVTRIMIKDDFVKTFPALFYCLLNVYLSYNLAQTL